MKVMFICTGNICRSAMAEVILKDKVSKDSKLKDKIQVFSAGTFAEDGEMSTEDAIEVMEEYGINLKEHRATNVASSNIKEMDIILCATVSHKMMLIRMYPELKDKIFTMKEYVQYDEKDLDIKDPWGYDIEVYRMCAAEIEKCIDLMISKWYNEIY